MERQNTKIYWIVGLIVVGLILYNNNPEMFAISPSSNPNTVSYTNVNSLSGITLNGCWKERTVTSITQTKTKTWKVGWVYGCDCTQINTNKLRNDKTIYFYVTSDLLNYNQVKSYSASLESTLKSAIPFRNYNYVIYYQKYKSGKAWNSQGICNGNPDFRHITVSITPNDIETDNYIRGSAWPPTASISMPFQYQKNRPVIIHEFGHLFYLGHVITESYESGYKEYRTNYMISGSGGNRFMPWQEDIIVAWLGPNKIKSCYINNVQKYCYLDRYSKWMEMPVDTETYGILWIKDYVKPTRDPCLCR